MHTECCLCIAPKSANSSYSHPTTVASLAKTSHTVSLPSFPVLPIVPHLFPSSNNPVLKVEQSEVIEVVTQLQTQLEQLEVDLPGDDTFASLHQLINRKPDRKEMKRWLDTVLAAASKTTKRKQRTAALTGKCLSCDVASRGAAAPPARTMEVNVRAKMSGAKSSSRLPRESPGGGGGNGKRSRPRSAPPRRQDTPISRAPPGHHVPGTRGTMSLRLPSKGHTLTGSQTRLKQLPRNSPYK